MSSSRWYCRTCGIVRDVPHDPGYPGIPFCHHNAPGVKADRMVPIPSYHPFFGTLEPFVERDSHV